MALTFNNPNQNQSNLPSLSETGQQFKKLLENSNEKAKEKAAFTELASLAQSLNSESDGVNAIIQTFNEKLRALNLGVEAWVPAPAFVEYGYARVEGAWQLATRWKPDDVPVEGQKALLKEDRDTRIEGLEFVPEILRQLTSNAQKRLDSIKKVKALAASL